jgi:hypothetical protein
MDLKSNGITAKPTTGSLALLSLKVFFNNRMERAELSQNIVGKQQLLGQPQQQLLGQPL